MPPRTTSGSRRASGQPKSSRQQFSACGACRMRRVKCDLKDIQQNAVDGIPILSCSNCTERGIKCVDEFADFKAVKLLRRGRRLQQVEAFYGRVSQTDPSLPPSPGAAPQSANIIPDLQPSFFSSAFFRRFHVQRPIVDPDEFTTRFFEALKGQPERLGVAGQLIAKVLVTWAASYGVDEHGVEEPHDGLAGVARRKARANEMLRELLHLIDVHGILRKPSWDGVRVLLLIMPLTEDVQSPMERLSMYEATVSQVYTLCNLADVSSVSSGQGQIGDALVRARIFWYAHVHEGVTSGLRGGRLLLADDDLSSFQGTLPLPRDSQALTGTSISYSVAYRYATVPIRIAAACRKVHAALTGKAARNRPEIDEEKLQAAWESLASSWEELEGLRQYGAIGMLQTEDIARFVNGWKIFIFEAHNIIRETLKQRIVNLVKQAEEAALIDPSQPMEPRAMILLRTQRLHTIADTKCQDVAKHVVALVRQHLGTSFFEYDASLVRDGTFFAGFVLAGESGTEEDVNACLRALGEMRWAFSKSKERIETLKMVWAVRQNSVHQKKLQQMQSGSPREDAYPSHGHLDKGSPSFTLDLGIISPNSPANSEHGDFSGSWLSSASDVTSQHVRSHAGSPSRNSPEIVQPSPPFPHPTLNLQAHHGQHVISPLPSPGELPRGPNGQPMYYAAADAYPTPTSYSAPSIGSPQDFTPASMFGGEVTAFDPAAMAFLDSALEPNPENVLSVDAFSSFSAQFPSNTNDFYFQS